jgi:hypothetical protein
MTPLRVSCLPVLAIIAGACGDPDWVGTYEVTGQWNLAGPLADGRSASDVITELAIDQVAQMAPLPAGVREDLAIEIDALFGDELRMYIDSRTPAELRAGGELTTLLSTSLANVTVTSELTLEEGGDGVEGTERFTRFELTDNVGTLTLMPGELGQTEIAASWEGEEEESRFTIEPHDVAIQYGQLVKLAAERAFTAADLETLQNDLLFAVDCSGIVNVLLDGQPSREVTVAGLSFDVEADTLMDACTAMRSLIEDNALGLFAIDAKIQLGGPVIYTDRTLRNGENFGGIVSIAPAPIAPKVRVTFAGQQNE